jgi:GNAT superfamily N-acetyltransferase
MISISEDIQLQNIKIEDQGELMTLLSQIYPPAYKYLWVNEDCEFYLNKFYTVENLKLELSDQNAAYYFVYFKCQLVGIFRFVHSETFKDFPEHLATFIHRIYLGEEVQGKGVARQLFYWVEQKAKEKGNSLIWLKAMDTKQQALRFYEKQNFKYGSKSQLDFELIHNDYRGMYSMYKLLSKDKKL